MRIIYMAAVILVGFVFSAVQAAEKKVVNIGSQRGLFAALAYAAKDKGYLEDYRINLKWHWFQAGPQMLQAMRGGDIVLALPVGASPAMAAARNGQQIHFFSQHDVGKRVYRLEERS